MCFFARGHSSRKRLFCVILSNSVTVKLRWSLLRSPRQLLLPTVLTNVRVNRIGDRQKQNPGPSSAAGESHRQLQEQGWSPSPLDQRIGWTTCSTVASGAVGVVWKNSGRNGEAWVPQNLQLEVLVVSFRILPQAIRRTRMINNALDPPPPPPPPVEKEPPDLRFPDVSLEEKPSFSSILDRHRSKEENGDENDNVHDTMSRYTSEVASCSRFRLTWTGSADLHRWTPAGSSSNLAHMEQHSRSRESRRTDGQNCGGVVLQNVGVASWIAWKKTPSSKPRGLYMLT